MLSSQSWCWIIIVLTKQTFKHRSQANISMILWENCRQPKHAMAPWMSSRVMFLIAYYCRTSCFTVNGVVLSENAKHVNWSWAKNIFIVVNSFSCKCIYNFYRLAILNLYTELQCRHWTAHIVCSSVVLVGFIYCHSIAS